VPIILHHKVFPIFQSKAGQFAVVFVCFLSCLSSYLYIFVYALIIYIKIQLLRPLNNKTSLLVRPSMFGLKQPLSMYLDLTCYKRPRECTFLRSECHCRVDSFISKYDQNLSVRYMHHNF